MTEKPNPQNHPDQLKPNQNSDSKKAVRPAYMMLVVGTNGTGKTTFSKELVAGELRKPNGHALIITPDEIEWNNVPEVNMNFPERISRYVGARRIVACDDDIEQHLINIKQYFRNGLIIFDDSRGYFTDKPPRILRQFLVRRRQLTSDILVIGHGFSQIQPAFFSYATHIALFNTPDPVSTRKERFYDIKKWEAIQNRINTNALTDPHYKEIHKI
jgi:hypothetical protein